MCVSLHGRWRDTVADKPFHRFNLDNHKNLGLTDAGQINRADDSDDCPSDDCDGRAAVVVVVVVGMKGRGGKNE